MPTSRVLLIHLIVPDTGYVSANQWFNHYCPVHDKVIPCPANSEAPSGSSGPEACRCLPGYENVAYHDKSNWFTAVVLPESDGNLDSEGACEANGGLLASINSWKEAQVGLSVAYSSPWKQLYEWDTSAKNQKRK